MTIYRSLERPVRLYIKKCPHCNLQYFGKTEKENIQKYQGSGKRWTRHLNKHHVKAEHIWNSKWYFDESIIIDATKFSFDNNIVESDKWANFAIENGITGGYLGEEVRKLQSEKAKKIKNDPEWKATKGLEAIEKMKQTVNSPEWKQTIGITKSKKQVANTDYKEVRKKQVDNTDYKEVARKISNKHKDFEWANTTGKEKARKSSEIQNSEEWKKNNFKTCEYCNLTCSPGNYKRWHGNNCKEKEKGQRCHAFTFGV